MALVRGMPAEWVFYDGDCGFCHRWVRLVVKLDHDGRAFRFAPRKGETFRSLVAPEQREALPPSILVLTREGRILTRSSAVLHILEQLGGGWRVMAIIGRIVPAGTRDVVYRFIAHVRHGLLPAPESACPVVAPEFRARFGP
jgi:predicted DCC family thiol-disulfide oxidoreductase YuxK